MPGVPGKPGYENVDKTTMKITWSSPESDGGSPVTGYVVEMCKDNGKWGSINDEEVSRGYESI